MHTCSDKYYGILKPKHSPPGCKYANFRHVTLMIGYRVARLNFAGTNFAFILLLLFFTFKLSSHKRYAYNLVLGNNMLSAGMAGGKIEGTFPYLLRRVSRSRFDCFEWPALQACSRRSDSGERCEVKRSAKE